MNTTWAWRTRPLHGLLLGAAVLAAAAGVAGCRGRSFSLSRTRPRPVEEEPAWVFRDQGAGRFAGKDVIQAVGICAHVVGYEQQVHNAREQAAQRLAEEIQAFLAPRVEASVARMDPPEQDVQALRRGLIDAVERVAREVAAASEPVAVHESRLRREVFVLLAVPIRRLRERYEEEVAKVQG